MTGGPYHIETSSLICRANQWFLYDKGLRHETVNGDKQISE